MGPIAGQRINVATKVAILTVIATSQQQGVSARRSCLILAIEHRRIVRWQQRARVGPGLVDRTPGPKAAWHRVLREEIDQIVAMATSQDYVDLSHRILAVTAWDQGRFQASFSTVYRVLKERNLMRARGPGGAHNGHSKAPVRKDLTGPNQRWCWDISYLMTFQKGVYLYLYLLLDEWSRKAIQWRVSWHQTTEESRLLLEGGLVEQNILDLTEDQRPELINDRGRQMKAKPIQRLCEDHRMPQLFARPRTPNDNPYIESAFSTVKRAPEYPGRFLDDGQVKSDD
ncbi:MAG: DDE-type integrase/transposase/recombinase [Limisphaerales bacterium]